MTGKGGDDRQGWSDQSVRGSQGTVTLEIDNPPANALDNATLDALGDDLAGFVADPPRGIVISATGDRFFSAGGDVKELSSGEEAAGITRLDAFNRVLLLLDAMPCPVGFAVTGTAVGGGTEMILFADFAVGVRGSRFGLPELDHGLLSSAVSIARATQRLGERTARQLVFSAELFGADQAHEIGLIDELVDDPDLARQVAAEWVLAMSRKPRVLVAAAKDIFRRARSETHADLAALTNRQFLEYFNDAETTAARDRLLERWYRNDGDPG